MKYCKGRCDVDMFEPKQDCSNTWRGILENAKHLRRGVKAEVGNGKRALFWFHNWATPEPLCKLAISPVPPDID